MCTGKTVQDCIVIDPCTGSEMIGDVLADATTDVFLWKGGWTLAVCLGVTAFWVAMVFDVIVKEKEDKWFWLLVVIFLFWFGALLYCLLRKQKRA